MLKLKLKLETVKVCGRWSKMAFWLEWQFDLGMATGHQVIDDMLNSYKQNNSSTVPNISKNKNISKFVDFCIFQMKKKIEKFKRHPSDVHCCQYIIYFVSSWIYDGNHTGRKPKTKWSRFRERFPWMTSPAKDSSHFRARWPLIAKWSFFFFLSLFKAMSGGNNKNKSGIIRRWPRSAVTPVTLKFA